MGTTTRRSLSAPAKALMCSLAAGRLPAHPLRQRTLQEQAGTLQGVRHLAQNAGESVPPHVRTPPPPFADHVNPPASPILAVCGWFVSEQHLLAVLLFPTLPVLHEVYITARIPKLLVCEERKKSTRFLFIYLFI